jgi:hypothetical protein
MVREIDYDLEYTYSKLILGGMTLIEAKQTDYVDSLDAASLWRKVSKDPTSYTPSNEIGGAVWATWDIYKVPNETQACGIP